MDPQGKGLAQGAGARLAGKLLLSSVLNVLLTKQAPRYDNNITILPLGHPVGPGQPCVPCRVCSHLHTS